MPDIKFAPKDLSRAKQFAVKAEPHLFKYDDTIPTEQTIQNIITGKLGEIAFKRYLEKNHRKPLGCECMWEIFEDTAKGDEADFKTGDDATIDIKTARKPSAKRLIVPCHNKAMDYYVGIRLHEKKSAATLDGYATREEMELLGVIKLGDGTETYQRKRQDLHPISELLERFPPDQKDDPMPAPAADPPSPPLKPTADHVHTETALLEQWPTFSGYKCSWIRDSNGFPNFIFTAEEEIAEKREKNGDLWWSVKDDTALTGYRKVLEIKILGRRRPSHKRITTLVWILIALTVINLPSTLNTLRQYIDLLSPWISSTLHNLP